MLNLFATVACASLLAAQPRNANEMALGAVVNSPLGAGGVMFARVGIVQREGAITARFGLEAMAHSRADPRAPITARGFAGAAYDLRVRATSDGPESRLLAGLGLYRTFGVQADAYPAWLLAPRIGASVAVDFAHVQLGAEIALQCLALSNFGAGRGRLKRAFIPMVVTARF